MTYISDYSREQIIKLSDEWLSSRAISRKTGLDRKTIAKYRKWFTPKKNDISSRYDFYEEKYIFHTKDEHWNKKDIYAPLSLIDDIYLRFSIKWYNWSTQQIINWLRSDHNLDHRFLQIVKNRLWLQKYSDCVSPVSLQRADNNWNIDSKIIDTVNKAQTQRYYEKFKKIHNELLEKNVVSQWKILASYDTLFDHYKHYLLWYKPNTYKIERKIIKKSDSLFLAISDLHIWRTTDIIEKRLWYIASVIIEKKESDVIIFDLWDELETIIADWMHTSQIFEMDYLWVEQLIKWVKIVAQFLYEIWKHKNVEYNIITKSNHMRVDKEHYRDPQRIAWYIFWYMLSQEIKIMSQWWMNIKVNILNDKVSHAQYDWYTFILSHWDDWFNKKKTLDIVHNQWISWSYSVVLSWDWHTAYIEQGRNYSRVRIPSLNEPWQYATDNSLCHQPWYVIIENRKWKPPYIAFHPVD